MSRKKLAWANKEVETFVCILGEEDVVYDVYVAAAAIDIRPTTKVEMRHKRTIGNGHDVFRYDVFNSMGIPERSDGAGAALQGAARGCTGLTV
ncbi:unnamed protein product [Boreogadus saida]